MKKIYTLFVLMLMPLMAFAQTSRTINVATAGTLPDMISGEEKYTIEELTLTGQLNGTDFRLLRDMAGCNYLGDKTEGSLKNLDISGAKIVAGGEKYLDTNHIPHYSGPGLICSIEKDDEISNYLFAECNLLEVKLPKGIKTICSHAFFCCSSLSSIVIPNGVESFEEEAFHACGKLSSVTIPSSATTIGRLAFCDCTGLTSLTISDGVITIGENAFSNCGITSVTIPNSVTTLGEGAFRSCGLTSIAIPKGVTEIGKGVFASNNLTSITVDKDNKVFDSRDNCNAIIVTATNTLMYGLNTTIIPESVEAIGDYAFQNCSFARMEIPNGIKKIGAYAFDYNLYMRYVVIPSSVTSIGSKAFKDCWSLKDVAISGHIEEMGDGAFSETCPTITVWDENPSNLSAIAFNDVTRTDIKEMTGFGGKEWFYSHAKLVVPQGTLEKYQSTSGWKEFQSIEEMKPYNSDLETPLTFEAIEGKVTVSIYNKWITASNIVEYSVDGGPWTEFYVPDDYAIPDKWKGKTTIPAGHIVRLRSNSWYGGKGDYMSILCDADCYVYGNVMSLVKGENFATDYASLGLSLGRLFYNNKHIKNHPEKSLLLPSTTLTFGCYMEMFSGCTGLTKAPELPSVYLARGCYSGMFKGCSNLNYVDCKATSFEEGATTGWLDGVASTGTFRKPLSMTTWPRGGDGIPEGWTVEDLESISVGSSGYSTYNNEGLNLDFSETEEMKAYVATGYDYDMNTIWLTRVKDVPAGMPIMVKGSINTGYDIPVEEVSVSYFVNMFKANDTGSPIELSPTDGDMTNYYLSNGIFKSSTGSNTINPGKCYLQIPTVAPVPTVGSSRSVTLNANGFASFCGSVDYDFTDVEGLKAYAATGYDDATGTIWLTRVKRVSAGTGLLLMGAAGGSYTIPSTGVSSYYVNMMVGNQTSSDITIYTTSGDMTNYYLKGNKLLKADGKDGNPIKPGKAYMQIPTKHVTRGGEGGVMPEELAYQVIDEPEVIPMQALTRALGGEDDGTTDIRETVRPRLDDNVFYNLQGQRVDKPTKGLYIRNGKVIVIK